MEDCRRKLEIVLERLLAANVKVNWEKCKFFVSTLPYLGHIVTDRGLLPSPDKLETIRAAKVPINTSELKAYLGLVNYYGKFVPHLSTKLSDLYNLLRKNVKFIWTKACQTAFENSKQELINADLLEYFDPKKPLVIVSDACNYGLGGVLAHVINGVEKPICFTSFSLNEAQKKYPILHLEALALVCSIKKFHKFVYGQKFTVFTDHKPLVGIFGKEGGNSIYVTRLQRYVLELSIYDFDIIYRPSAKMGNADFCSRFPLLEEVPKECDVEYVKSLNLTNELPMDFSKIANETSNDAFMQKVITFLQNGWPEKLDKMFLNIHSNQHDLEVVEGCVMFQDRVMIPSNLRKPILRMLHVNHSGVVKMKQLARRIVYWPGVNNDIEEYVRNCDTCTKMSVVPKPSSTTEWIPTTRPFSRLHADFFHFEHKVFLLIADSHSKWLEVEWMRNGTDASRVIRKFTKMFSCFGLPDVVVTDGGPPFNSALFVSFLEKQGIKVFKSPPYNPSSNGQAERMVRLVKDVFKKFLLEPEVRNWNTEDQIDYFLINYL